MPAQINATLTHITAATAASGGRDDWDEARAADTNQTPVSEPAGTGAVKWEGYAGAYLTDGLIRVDGPNGPKIGTVRVLYIDSAIAVAADLDTDDVLEFTDQNGREMTGEADMVAVRQLAGIPGNLQTTRIQLRD